MRHSQRGVTFIGWLFLLSTIGNVVYEGIRLTPVYLNYLKVVRALDRLKESGPEGASGPATAASLHVILQRSFEINSIDNPNMKDIDIQHYQGHWTAIADYDDEAPLFANVTLVVHFHKEVDVP